MKTYTLVIILIYLALHTFSQNEMEMNCMKRIKHVSVNVQFPKYEGQINVSKDTIKFGKSVIILFDTEPEFIKLFELGLLFPDLIEGTITSGETYKSPESSIADTLYISNLEELHFRFQKSNRKWFRFLEWNRNWKDPFINLNPALYLFELTNKNKNSKNNLRIFIEKAKVTAFGFCSILI